LKKIKLRKIKYFGHPLEKRIMPGKRGRSKPKKCLENQDAVGELQRDVSKARDLTYDEDFQNLLSKYCSMFRFYLARDQQCSQ
jgi:hypothetical protein